MNEEVNITDEELLEKHKDAVEKFKQFCLEHGGSVEFEELNFYDLSVGFFVALGITGDGNGTEPYYEAFTLARICRYSLGYWEP